MADMTTKILTVEIDADKAINGIVNLNNAIDKNTQQIKANNAMIAENNKAMQQEGADAMALVAQNQKLAQSNVELEAKTRALKDEKRALMKETQNEIKMQTQAEGSLKSLRAQLSNLTKQYDSLSKAERQNEQVGGALLKQINSVTTEIKTAEEETQRYFRNVGNYPETAESVKGALRSMQDEIINLTMEYRQMSDEMQNSEAGQAMKQRIEELTQKASEYKDAMSDVKQSIREGASDTRGLDTAIQAGQTLAATFGLANNAAVALGISTDGLQQAMLKMQQAMQAVQALQVIQNALQKQSNLMRGIDLIQTKAANAAKALNAKITAQETGATIAQTAAQRVFNAVAKANPYVLLATAILAVIGLVVSYTSALNDNAEAEQRSQRARQQSQESLKAETEQQKMLTDATKVATDELEARKVVEGEMATTVANSVSEQLANYTYLQKKWAECGNDIKLQQQFLNNYKNELNNTGFAVKTVYDAQNILVKQAPQVIKMYYAMAQAAAAAAVAQRAFERMIERAASNDVKEGTAMYKIGGKGAYKIGDPRKSIFNVTTEEFKYLREQARQGNLPDNQIEFLYADANGAEATGLGIYGDTAEQMLREYRKQKARELKKAKDDADKHVADVANQFRSEAEGSIKDLRKQIGVAYTGKSGGRTAGGGSRSSGGGRSSGGSSRSNAASDAKDSQYFFDKIVDMQVDAYQKMAKEDDKYTEMWKLKQIRAILAKEQAANKAIDEEYKKDQDELDKSRAANKITQAQYNLYITKLGEQYDNKRKIARQEQIAGIKAVYDDIAKHEKEVNDKAAKDAADALKREKEIAEKQVQTMLDSMPEGSRGQMQWRLTQLAMQMQEELKMWENNEQMKVAIQKKYEQESEQVANEYLQHQMELQQQKYEAFGKIAGGLSQLFGEFADESKEAAILQKSLATAEVMLAQAVAIANAIKAAAMGSINPWQMIAQIATSVTAVTIAMVQAFKSLDKAKFATGGYISGAGTGTSDSIPVRVSNGESIINANSTAMFSGLLSSLNQLGGGVPIQATSTAQTVQGEDMLARAFARGVAMLPNPVVSVQDINDGQRQVQVMTERATL